MGNESQKADVCLFLEGTYPYIPGGVSTWTHELIQAQSHLTFHIVALLPAEGDTTLHYKLPKNVLSIKNVFLQTLEPGSPSLPKREMTDLFASLEVPLLTLQTHASLKVLKRIITALDKYHGQLGTNILLNSEHAWNMGLRMYNSTLGDSPFLEYFWSSRALLGGLYSVMLADMPEADVYHALCTGYAGLFLARAHLKTGKPCIVTEHGIYTNERRIEIASADWLVDQKAFSLAIKKKLQDRELRDFWIDTFFGYSTLCYEACDEIITLYGGNQEFQIMDGAAPSKLRVIPNGINFERYSKIAREKQIAPTIALIGRVVPIKDIKTYIRTCGVLRDAIPDLKALIIGPTGEDEDYYKECLEIVEHASLEDTIVFTGKTKIDDYLGKIDVMVLSSISEGQPLVILEAGAAGIPTVATDVGACREMIYGQDGEDASLGAGGAISPLSNPKALAEELLFLLTNEEHYQNCSKAIKKRVEKYYNKNDLHTTYSELYEALAKKQTQMEQVS